MSKLFSILIPSRNRLDLLRHAIASVAGQDFTDYEIIVSDNASDPPYAEPLRDLEGPVAPTVLRSDEPLSVTRNWARALEAATGDYVIMLGDDDALVPGALARLAGLIDGHGRPDVVYVMAYHYAYPGVFGHAPAGYFCAVNNSPVFDRDEPYLLPPEEARALARKAVQFRHQISFNAQHFVWRRDYIARLGQPLFQSPYPDYFACFVTFSTAATILVDPTPQAIIGIAKQSFGFYFARNQESEGFGQFLGDAIDPAALADGSAAVVASLEQAGSGHYRNWLIAALTARRALRGFVDLPIDLRRYGRIQAFEAAHRAGYLKTLSRSEFRAQAAALGSVQGRLGRRLLRQFMLMDKVAAFPRELMSYGMTSLLNIHHPPKIHFYEIGRHGNILDAWRWLADRPGTYGRTREAADAPAALDPRDAHVEELTTLLRQAYARINEVIEIKDVQIEALHAELASSTQKRGDLERSQEEVRAEAAELSVRNEEACRALADSERLQADLRAQLEHASRSLASRLSRLLGSPTGPPRR